MDVLDLVNDHNHVGPGHDILLRPFVCTFQRCDKAFARKSDLARHFRIHTNDRYDLALFSCLVGSLTTSSLPPRPFLCTETGCEKSFIQRSALTVHRRVHTGERPHHCESCNKAFADSSSLARHRRIHSGKRPYSCKVDGCGRSFARRNTYLKHHKRTHPTLPPPSSSSTRAVVHMTPYGRMPSGSFLAPGPNGQPQWYLPNTPSTIGPPHAVAASYPPEGAAHAFGGGYSGHFVGYGAVGGGLPRQAYHHPAQGHGELPSPAVQTPISAITHSTHGDLAQSLHSPASPGSRTQHLGSHHTSENPYAFTPQGYHHYVGHSNYPAGYPTYSAAQDHSGPRFPPTSGMMFYNNKESMSGRSLSGPHDMRPTPAALAPWGGVGGGFSAGQLALPAAPHMHLQPSYHSYSMTAEGHTKALSPDKSPRAPRSLPPDSGDIEDDMSPEPPLVALSEVPSFEFHSSSGNGNHTGPQLSTPYSAHPFSQQLTVPPQLGIPRAGQPQSAPPHLQRHHSMPNPGAGWTDNGVYPAPSSYDDAHLGSTKREDEEWQDIQTEMLSQEGSDAMEVDMTEKPKTSQPLATPVHSHHPEHHWDPNQPTPYHPHFDQHGRLASSASTISSTSTLVASNTLPPISVFSQGNGGGFNLTPIHHPGYFTPITPHGTWISTHPHQHPHMKPRLGSPVSLSRPYTPDDHEADGDVYKAHAKTGLGIQGVQYDTREAVDEEGEEEIDDDIDLEDENEVEEDDSDEEFFPTKLQARKGGKLKPAKGSRSKRRGLSFRA
ncbi:hypothetical protein P7C73_g4219, partial [Tremellales sp. Uapishka_1]